jgi:hypothetical protein
MARIRRSKEEIQREAKAKADRESKASVLIQPCMCSARIRGSPIVCRGGVIDPGVPVFVEYFSGVTEGAQPHFFGSNRQSRAMRYALVVLDHGKRKYNVTA